MLNLIKYELLYSKDKMLPFYAGAIAVSLLATYAMESMRESWIFSVVLPILMLFFFGGMIVMNFVIIVMRFHKNLFSREGYLMHTLPVSANKLIISKIISAFFWSSVTVGVIMIAFAIPVFNKEGFETIILIFQRISENIDLLPTFMLQLIAAVSGMFTTLLFIYMIISMANSKLWIKSPKVAGVLYSIVIQLVVSTVSGELMKRVFSFDKLDSSFGNLITSAFFGTRPDLVLVANANTALVNINHMTIWTIVLNLILAIIYYFVTIYFMKNHLNLD